MSWQRLGQERSPSPPPPRPSLVSCEKSLGAGGKSTISHGEGHDTWRHMYANVRELPQGHANMTHEH